MALHSQRFATETLIRLSEKIPNIEIILEYSIKPYRVDAYLPEYNISIEIDENDHAVYDPEKEFERSRYITNTLHCSWIRVNNNDTIENTVEHILKQLKYYGVSSTTTAPQELIKEPQLPSSNALQNKSYVQQLREFKAQQAEKAAKLELERLQQKASEYLSSISTVEIETLAEFVNEYFEITSNVKDRVTLKDFRTQYAKGINAIDEDTCVKIYKDVKLDDVYSYLERKYGFVRRNIRVVPDDGRIITPRGLTSKTYGIKIKNNKQIETHLVSYI